MAREDQFMWGLTIDGRDLGFWDKGSGGNVDSNETKYKPAGLPAVTLGGSVTTENVTLQRLYEIGRDDVLEPWLISRAGKGNGTASKIKLDDDDNPVGKPLVYVAKLKQVIPPDTDSESGSAALIQVELSVARPPT